MADEPDDRTFGTSRRQMLALLGAVSAPPSLAAQTITDRRALRERILAEFGPALPPATVGAMGEVFARHEAQFLRQAAAHWQADGANWENANYYDRARIFYIYYARTGDDVWLRRADDIALDYRSKFIEATNYGPSAHWAQMSGLYLHYLATGDAASRTAILKVGELFSLPYYLKNLDNLAAEMDCRIQARTLLALLYASRVARQEPARPAPIAGDVWAGRLREALGRIAASQGKDGAFRFKQVQCGHNKPYMVGLLNDALIEYHRLFEKDPRILAIIRASLEYLWAKNWRESSRAYVYLEGTCGEDGPVPAPDLNLLMVSGIGFLLNETGDSRYRAMGDAVMQGGVEGAWLAGTKVFNQNYFSAYRYPAYRARAGQ